MDHIFSDILLHTVIVYLDDILFFSTSPSDHRQHVKEVLRRLFNNHLYCKLEKCEFHRNQVAYLGYIISANGVAMDPKKVSGITDWPIPMCIKDLQRFLGFTNFYRRFIPHYFQEILPLTALLKKNVRFFWSEEAQLAFEGLKQHFLTGPILITPDQAKRFIIESDRLIRQLGPFCFKKMIKE
ncbi:uncharacterized protein [Ambystoma mexicanum]|uniref:uncharacterized protein n=1 Tax=Ambystoma mexicanum TaxID=8296 RepID=UPI0037E96F5A